MDKVILAIVAMIIVALAGTFVIESNDILCERASCKMKKAQQLAIAKAEADERLSAAPAERQAARERADKTQDLAAYRAETDRKVAEANLARQHEQKMAQIRADEAVKAAALADAADRRASDRAIALAKIHEGSRPREVRREGGGIIGMMCRNGMGQCGQPRRRMVRRPPPGYGMPPRRQPRYEMVLNCGIPGNYRPCR